MSKAVTNEEVEDVLSSIRRLVSEDKRPLAGFRSVPTEDAGDAPEPEEVPSEADRLVLTPALRVAPPKIQEIEPDDSPLDLGSVARQTWTNDRHGGEASRDPVELRGDDAPMQLFPKADIEVPDEAMDALDALVHSALESEVQSLEEDLESDDYSGEAFWDEDENDASTDAVDAKEDEDASDFAGRNMDDGDWDADNGESALDASPNENAGETVAAEEAPSDREVEATLPRNTQTEAPKMQAAAIPLTAKIAALEAAINGARRQDWDGDEVDELKSPDAPAMAWEDDVELDATGAPFVDVPEETVEPEKVDTAPSQATTPLGSAFGGDDQLMDEEALRDLVGEIVRAELQGALGERITRNVRKLVRREIHRALTAQEME